MKNILNALALAPVVAGSIALAPAPAEAFWGPSNGNVCRTSLEFAESARRETISSAGMEAPVFTGTVTASNVNTSIPPLGYEQVTGCVTQFTWLGSTWVQSFNVEKDAAGGQYYVQLGAAQQLMD